MTYSRERGGGEAGAAGGLGLLLRRIAARVGRRIGRVPPSAVTQPSGPATVAPTATAATVIPAAAAEAADKAQDDASFEAHVDQALQIASQLPTLRVVSLSDAHSAARM